MADKEILDPPAGGSGEAAPGSPPATGDQPGDSPPPTGDQPTDSPPSGAEPESNFAKALNGLQAEDEPADDSPPSQAAQPAGDGAPKAKTDEPANGAPKPPTAPDLSHEYEKAFNERAEWKGLLALSKDPEKAKPLLRQVLQRETALAGQIKQLQPVAELGQRLRAATKDDTATANAVALVEAWFAGKPEALGMLKELQGDLETRLGQRLTSPDLVAKAAKIDEALEAMHLLPEEAAERKAELLEIEKARAGQRQAENERKQTESQKQSEAVEKLIEARTVALNQWEELGPLRNPDYANRPEMQQRVIADAQVKITEREAKLGRMLNPAEMVECAQAAYDDVLKFLTGFLPKPQAQRLPPGGGSSRSGLPKAKTFGEALDSAAEVL